jgi:transposase
MEKRALQRQLAVMRRKLAAEQKENQSLRKRIAEVEAALESAQRQGKRQAAPFSKGPPKKQPRKRGRKPGARYGKKAFRAPPSPEQIDQRLDAPLPDSCPYCGGHVEEERVVPQYQVEIPLRPICRQFDVHMGSCQQCGRRLQGTHPWQTSDALGAAASQLGPDLQAAAAILNKYGGLSYGKMVRVFSMLFGVTVTAGGLAQAVQRAGRRCRGAYDEIRRSVAGSRQVVADETGWRLEGRPAWLHALVGDRATYYGISRRRDAEVAAAVLGWDYHGTLVHDGWSSYDRFAQAGHQQCVGHVLARVHRMLEVASGGAVHFPRRVKAIFQEALRLRNAYEAGQLSEDDLSVGGLSLACQLEALTEHPKQHAANERLSKHLRNHLWEWFRFLFHPGIAATNWPAEHAIRLGVINRKVWGGNRDARGGDTQAVLMSVTETCFRLDVNPLSYISRALRTWNPRLIPP